MGQCKDFFVPLHANMFLTGFAAFGACALLLTDGLVACASALQKIKSVRCIHKEEPKKQRGTKGTKKEPKEQRKNQRKQRKKT